MKEKRSNLLDYAILFIKWRRVIIINALIIGLLSVGLSLIVPLWYKGSATILPPQEGEESTGFSALLSQIPLPSSLFSMGGVSQSASLVLALLQSRTVMESVVTQFDLIKRYKEKNMEEAVRTLRDRCSFKIEEDGTVTISTSVRTGFFHPKSQVREAKLLARDMTNFFIQQLDFMNKRLRTEKAKNVRLFLEKRYNENMRDLANTEEALRDFQEKYGTIALPEQTLAAIEAAAGLKAEIISKKIELGVLKQTVGASHPNFSKAKTELDELERGYDTFHTGDTLKGRGLFPPFSKVPEYGLEYARLIRDIKLQEILLEFLLPQYEQARIQEAKDTPTIQIIDEAVLPIRKDKPKRIFIVLFSVMLSGILSFFYALAVEKLRALKREGGEDFKKINWVKTQLKGDVKNIFRRNRR